MCTKCGAILCSVYTQAIMCPPWQCTANFQAVLAALQGPRFFPSPGLHIDIADCVLPTGYSPTCALCGHSNCQLIRPSLQHPHPTAHLCLHKAENFPWSSVLLSSSFPYAKTFCPRNWAPYLEELLLLCSPIIDNACTTCYHIAKLLQLLVKSMIFKYKHF